MDGVSCFSCWICLGGEYEIVLSVGKVGRNVVMGWGKFGFGKGYRCFWFIGWDRIFFVMIVEIEFVSCFGDYCIDDFSDCFLCF